MLLESARWLAGRIVLTVEKLTAPTPPQRSPEEQAAIDARTSNLAIYEFQACPFCMKVRQAMRRMGLKVELRDALGDPKWAAELREQGGRRQVPCLKIVDSEGNEEWLYESSDIIAWFEERFA